MSVIRLASRKQYTIVAQESIRDDRLSLKARGLHVYLLSFPDDWEFSIKHITDSLKDGRASVRSALAELVELGYAERITPRNDDGTVAGTTYLVYESPRDRETENRTLGSSVESSTKSNKNNVSTERPKDRQSVLPQLPITEEEPIKEPIIESTPEKEKSVLKEEVPDPKPPSKNKRFIKPTIPELTDYFSKRGATEIEAEKFFDHFESNGWRVGGKGPMVDWKSAVRNWIRNIPQFSPNNETNGQIKMPQGALGL